MKPKFNKVLCIACWLGTMLCVFLMGYLFYMARKYPEMDVFTRYVWLVGALALLWCAAAVWFTVQARQEKNK